MAEVEVTREGAVQTITLNRPDVINAFNRAMHAALRAALKEAADPEVRAVVLTGAGRGFCAGQDLTEFQEMPDVREALNATYHPNVLAIRALEKPVIAAVNGACAGAGLSLACSCDIRVAAADAVFVPGFVGIGLVPDAGGTHFIHRLLGASRAFEWMTSNRRLTAAEALEWGLVSQVVEPAELQARAAELAATLAAGPTRAIGMTKRLFDHAETATLEEQLEMESQLQAAATQSEDFREGVAAFVEKRPPSFSRPLAARAGGDAERLRCAAARERRFLQPVDGGRRSGVVVPLAGDAESSQSRSRAAVGREPGVQARRVRTRRAQRLELAQRRRVQRQRPVGEGDDLPVRARMRHRLARLSEVRRADRTRALDEGGVREAAAAAACERERSRREGQPRSSPSTSPGSGKRRVSSFE